MPTKTILITGATDGIGLEAARALSADGHRVLLHGRSPEKLARVADELAVPAADTFLADLSDLSRVRELAQAVAARLEGLDVLINNAGVFKTSRPRTAAGHDVRFVVNTLAPVLLTELLLPLLGPSSRVVNLSSAAQSPVDLDALAGRRQLDEFGAYAQSKLALTMWSAALAQELGPDGPVVVAVNPGSLLDTKMVREGFGRSRAGADVGADILVRAALSEEFAEASGRYFDNDSGQFAAPHPEAGSASKAGAVVAAVRQLAGVGEGRR